MSSDAVIVPPNYTQIPNALFEIMPEMKESELRVVLAIARKTFGWRKDRDVISITQLIKATGMTRQGVVNGIEAALMRKIIERTSASRGGFWYRLVIVDINDVDQSTKLTSQQSGLVNLVNTTSQRSRLDLVNEVDSQKKDLKKLTKESESEYISETNHALTKDPAIVLFFECFPDETLSGKQIQSICSTATEIGVWRTVLKLFQENEWAPRAGNLLDRYRKEIESKPIRQRNANGQAPIRKKPIETPAMLPTDNPNVLSREDRMKIAAELRAKQEVEVEEEEVV